MKDRESVDVNTGERIVIEGRDKISFTPDTILKEIINKPFAQFETVVVNDGVEFDEIDRKFEAEEQLAENQQMDEAEEIPEPLDGSENQRKLQKQLIFLKSLKSLKLLKLQILLKYQTLLKLQM